MVMNWNIYSFIDFPHAVPAAAVDHPSLYVISISVGGFMAI